MRNTLSLIAAMLVFVALGCDESTAPVSQPFEIHVQSSFDQTWVQFECDGQIVFFGNQTTDHLLGLASIVRASAAPGLHMVRVLAGDTEQTVSLDLISYKYVVLRRSSQDGTIQVLVTDERPIYD